MRIAYLSYQRNLDVPGHETWYTDIDEIEKQGWETVLARLVAFQPDIVIEREFNDGRALYMPLLSAIKKALPTVIRAKWFIDSHVVLELHKLYAKEIDVGFFAIRKYAQEFQTLLGQENAFWLPLCFPDQPEAITINYAPINYPVSFVGRWNKDWFPKRTEYIEKLRAKYDTYFHAVTDYTNYRTLLKQSKVSFNCSLNGDLNFRVFEVLGAGTELVTDSVPDLYKIKGLQERLHVYGDSEELFAIIDRILADDPEITTNTIETQQWIENHHTICNRMEELLSMIESRKQYGY